MDNFENDLTEIQRALKSTVVLCNSILSLYIAIHRSIGKVNDLTLLPALTVENYQSLLTEFRRLSLVSGH